MIPKYLYKYRPINHLTLISILNSYNWFSSPIDFNDPFDCQIKIKNEVVPLEAYIEIYQLAQYGKIKRDEVLTASFPEGAIKDKKFTKDFKEKMMDFKLHVENDVKDRSILSLSEVFDNTSMWSHYSDSHKGICIEYDTNLLIPNKNYKEFYHKVNYLPSDEISFNSFNIYAGCSNNHNHEKYKKLCNELILTKSDNWVYEQEWRIMHNTKGIVRYSKPALTAIYFGLKCEIEEKRAIRNILHDVPMLMFQMVRREHSLKLDPLPMDKSSIYWDEKPD